jgi:hypothetical protein
MPFSVMKQWVEEAPINMIYIDEQDASMRGGNLQTQRESAVFGAQKNPSCSSSLMMQGGVTSEKKIGGCPKINCETSRKTSQSVMSKQHSVKDFGNCLNKFKSEIKKDLDCLQLHNPAWTSRVNQHEPKEKLLPKISKDNIKPVKKIKVLKLKKSSISSINLGKMPSSRPSYRNMNDSCDQKPKVILH